MISIIIPVYNGAEWLAEAIESALGQEYPIEVIIIDDGSTDNSLEIAKKYIKSSWGYSCKVISQVNKGLASARNTGIMNAKNNWILFLDADDILLPNCISQIEQRMRENDCDIIAPSFREFGLGNREVILMQEPKLEDFRTGNRLGYCAAIRRSVLLEVGGYSPKMVEGYEDLALWCDLLSRGKKVVTIPEVLWQYRIKKESMYTKITPEIHRKLIAQINLDVPKALLTF